MLLGPLLFSLLSQAAPVAALVGTRIYPLRIPQEQPRPAITYQLISRVPDGSAICALDDIARVQLSLFADTYGEIEALAATVRGALHRLSTLGVYLELDNEIDHHDDTADCYFRSQDYFLEIPAA
ncbi:hypothetical protein ACVWYF_004147 [Hymenobacter sp. UYAg731]